MMKPWVEVLKYFLMVFNVLIIIFGIILFGFGCAYTVNSWSIPKINDAPYTFVFICLLGIVDAAITACGWYAVFKRNKHCFVAYAALLFALAVLHLVLSSAYFSLNEFVEELNGFKGSLRKYYDSYATDADAKSKIDSFQKSFKCCGADGPEKMESYAPSCCKTGKEENCVPFETGCIDAALDYLKQKGRDSGGLLVCGSIVKMTAGCITVIIVVLLKHVHHHQ